MLEKYVRSFAIWSIVQVGTFLAYLTIAFGIYLAHDFQNIDDLEQATNSPIYNSTDDHKKRREIYDELHMSYVRYMG